MNEQLQHALVEIITKATTGMDTAISFLSAELPDVIHQLLMWKLVENLAQLILWMVLPISCIVCAIIFKRMRSSYDPGPEPQKEDYPEEEKEGYYAGEYNKDFKKWDKYNNKWEEPRFTLLLGAWSCWGITIISLPLIIAQHLTWLQILIAPKLYLIEYAAQLIK